MSTTTIDNSSRTFVAGEALDAYLLVQVTGDGTVDKATATAGQSNVGFTVTAAASGEAVSVSLLYGGGSSFGTASEAISIGDIVYGAADGKLTPDDSANGDKIGVSLSAATADGDIIEVLPINS